MNKKELEAWLNAIHEVTPNHLISGFTPRFKFFMEWSIALFEIYDKA